MLEFIEEDWTLRFKPENDTESYIIELSACPNPYCHCGGSLLYISREAGEELLVDEFILNVDHNQRSIEVDEPEILEAGEKEESEKFSLLLKNSLTDEDWQLIQGLYFSDKHSIIQNQDLQSEFHYTFSEIHQNDESLMIDFNEIYPAGEVFTVTQNEKVYVVIDQYCKTLDCDCSEINLFLYDQENLVGEFQYNYDTGIVKDPAFNWVIESLSKEFKELNLRFAVRNARCQMEYGKFQLEMAKKEYETLTKERSLLMAAKDSKIGRNDKCPCGSGKKYKHCCMK